MIPDRHKSWKRKTCEVMKSDAIKWSCAIIMTSTQRGPKVKFLKKLRVRYRFIAEVKAETLASKTLIFHCKKIPKLALGQSRGQRATARNVCMLRNVLRWNFDPYGLVCVASVAISCSFGGSVQETNCQHQEQNHLHFP